MVRNLKIEERDMEIVLTLTRKNETRIYYYQTDIGEPTSVKNGLMKIIKKMKTAEEFIQFMDDEGVYYETM